MSALALPVMALAVVLVTAWAVSAVLIPVFDQLVRWSPGHGGGTAHTLLDLPEPVALIVGWLRPSIAGTLVRCAHLGGKHQSPALAWSGGRLEQRVTALLDQQRSDANATPWLHHLLNLSL